MNSSHYDPKKLADARKKIGTQESVAKQVGVTVTQLSRAENGKSASFDLLRSIATLSGTDVLEILKSK